MSTCANQIQMGSKRRRHCREEKDLSLLGPRSKKEKKRKLNDSHWSGYFSESRRSTGLKNYLKESKNSLRRQQLERKSAIRIELVMRELSSRKIFLS